MNALSTALPYRSFRFSGDDALTFLQGQLTQDIAIIGKDNCHYAAYCDHKGRMLANFLLSQDDNGYILRLHEGQADSVIKRLQMFTLRAKVTIEALNNQHLGLNREAAQQFCQHAQCDLPNAFGVVTDGEQRLCALASDYFELIAPTEQSTDWLAAENNPACIERLRLQGGHFNIYPQTNELIQPQQTPLEAWGAINYHKGCYVGQEVIARSKYRGSVKKGLAFIELPAGDALALLTPVKQANRAVGQIIDQYSDSEHCFALALVSLNAIGETVNVNGADTTLQAIAL